MTASKAARAAFDAALDPERRAAAGEVFMTRRDVAKLLQLSPRQLRGRMDELTASGFPKPALGFGQNARWDPLAIEAWRKSKIPAAEIITGDGGPEISVILDQRAAALAAGKRRHH